MSAATLPLETGPSDDHPDTSGDNTQVAIGGAAQAGRIGVVGDVDRFRVELSAGMSYQFALSSGDTGLYASELVLLTGGGSQIARDSGGRKDGVALISYTAPTSGTYYLDALAIGGNTGAYTVQAFQTSTTPVAPEPVTNDDYLGTIDTTGVVVPNGAAAQGQLERVGDVDYFKVVLEANATYTFSLQGSGALKDTFLRLRTEDGRFHSSNDDGFGTKNGGSQIIFSPPSSGTYYLDVSSDRSQSGAYTLQATRTSTTPVTPVTPVTPQPDPVTNDDYPATNGTTGVVVPSGAGAQGQLERVGDVDYFKVALEANASYTFSLQGSGALTDTVLRLHAEDGRVLASDDDGAGTKNGASKISFTAPSNGMYYLDVSSDRSQSGAYTLQALKTSSPVTPQPDPVTIDDYPATTATTGFVTVNGAAAHGVLERAHDTDWLRVDLQAGVLYQLDIEGASSAGGTAPASPGLWLKTAEGNTLHYGNKSGAPRQSFVAPADGTYYVHVEALNGTSTGTYALKATTLPDDQPSSTATTGVVQVNGGATTGRIDAPRDADYFKVQLDGGRRYSFALSGTDGTGSLVDTYLRVRDADGKELAGNDDVTGGSKSSSSGLQFQAPASGTYYLEASGDGRLVGGYKLSAFTALSITAATPAIGAVNVSRSANLVLTLDRPVQSNHGTVTIQASPEQGGGMRQISLDDAGQVSINGQTITINPTSDLAANTKYTVYFSNGALQDTNGNVPEGLSQGTGSALSFTTVAANRAPTAADHTVEASPGLPLTGRLPTAVDADGDTVQCLVQELPRQGGRLTIEADGRYTYEAPFSLSGTDQFRFTVKDSQGATNVYTATINAAPLPVVQGTAQADTLTAATGTHRYAGLDGNDRISTGAGADVVDGGAGTDILMLSVPRSAATLQHRSDGGWTVGTSIPDFDQLIDIERLQFIDRSTALDLHGVAGQVARVIGTVFGQGKLADAALVGRYLAKADAGTEGEALVTQALADPLFRTLAGSTSNADMVRHVYQNIVGKPATPQEVDYYTSMITGGSFTQASLLWLVCGLDVTAQRIDLNGLAAHGLDFMPG